MNAERILRDIQKLEVLVMGDVCLDRWCYYDPKLIEPSRETGIPRIPPWYDGSDAGRSRNDREQSCVVGCAEGKYAGRGGG